MHLLARLGVLEHRPGSVEYRHQRGWRDDPDALGLRIIHHIAMVRMYLGKYSLGRDEHHGTIAGMVGNDVFDGNVIHVALDPIFEYCAADTIGAFQKHTL